jgi:hypothetical protein
MSDRSSRDENWHTACMGLFLSRGRGSTTFAYFFAFLGPPFFCSTAPQGFLPPRPQDTKADARSGGQGRRVSSVPPEGALVLDGREHGGML